MHSKIRKRIILDSPGQLCNRFWSYLDTIAWAIHNDAKVLILFWDPNIKYYDNFRNSKYVRFPFYTKRLDRWMRSKLVKRFNPFNHRTIFRIIVQTSLGNVLGLICGWRLRASHQYHPFLYKEIQELFQPNKDIRDYVDGVIKQCRDKGRFIVGVHIRRGDYINFEGGRFYFEIAEYKMMMGDIVELYSEKDVYFFISSDERIDFSAFGGFNIIDKQFPSAAHDLYGLSQCDRIIGPLSTFSRWASYYGRVPLLFCNRGMNIISDEQFSVVIDFYHFANGKEIPNLTDENKV